MTLKELLSTLQPGTEVDITHWCYSNCASYAYNVANKAGIKISTYIRDGKFYACLRDGSTPKP